ncbi:sigma-54 factor interaction domain-containing protein, partial [Bordetella pertussis]
PRAMPAQAPEETLPALAPALQAGFERARRALDGGLSVLLQGETGAGKEVYAQHLYRRSIWRDGPFVAVNCGAL